MDKMNPEVKGKWVAALRSGEYEQGQDELRGERLEGGYEFCCLGVLTDIYAKQRRIGFSRAGSARTIVEDDAGLLPSQKVCKWAGIPYIEELDDKPTESTGKLANMNDEGKTFKQIAAYIQRYL